ncbi:70-kilodalton heat shock protein [Basidiobolus ranarum]|uniref:70-kilodalton heat shock protein n=1 Tax=Basidiobolus ranarum TaxID=34480 RepID=A0ABR2VRN0_9FUNG
MINKANIHETILVGGSTIPKIQKLVSDYFNCKEPNKYIMLFRQLYCMEILLLRITISNDKGCLSNEDIESMVSEDEEVASCVSAKNQLESYAYSLRNTLQDEKVAGQIDVNNKKKLEKAINGTIS